MNAERQWLDVDAGLVAGRLFTAQVTRLKATYTFTARSFFRVIGQYEDIRRTVPLYLVPVRPREGAFAGSALYAYKLNWQTVLFLGYSDDRGVTPAGQLVPTGRQYFVKISYAFQR